MRAFRRRLLQDCRGAALVEFTLVMPLLLLLFLGFWIFGKVLWDHHTMETSLRSAARYLSRMPTVDQDPATPCANTAGTYAEQARQVALTGTPDGSGTPLLPYWSTAGLGTICISPITRTLTDAGGNTFNVTVIRMRATVPFAPAPALTLEAYHEERHIGE